MLNKGKRGLHLITDFCKCFADRTAGSIGEASVAQWIADKLIRIGIANVEIENFPVIHWGCHRAEINTPSIKRKISCEALPYSPSGTIRGVIELFDPFKRTPNVKNKIALIKWCEWDVTENKTQYLGALDSGALGVIFSDFYKGCGPRIFPITESPGWKFGAGCAPSIPVVSVSYESGETLAAISGSYIELIVETQINERAHSQNVVAVINGKKWPKEELIITAHHDAWFSGANDNASAVAALILLAEEFVRNIPQRTIRFISFGAEESGGLSYSPWCWTTGSLDYTWHHRDDIRRNVVAVINAELIATGDCITIQASGPEMRGASLKTAKRLGILEKYNDNFYCMPAFVNNDQYPFTLIGIPSLTVWGISPFKTWPEYHTSNDMPEIIDLPRFTDRLAFLGEMANDFANQIFLPYDIKGMAKEVLNGEPEGIGLGLAELAKLAENDLSLGEKVDQLKRIIYKSTEWERRVKQFNKKYNSCEKIDVDILYLAEKMNLRISKFLKAWMPICEGIVAFGNANKGSVPFIPRLFPGLQGIEDLAVARKALSLLKKGDSKGAYNILITIYPHYYLNENINFYPPRFRPGLEEILPFLDPSEVIISLKRKETLVVKDYKDEIISLERKLRCLLYQLYQRETELSLLHEIESILTNFLELFK